MQDLTPSAGTVFMYMYIYTVSEQTLATCAGNCGFVQKRGRKNAAGSDCWEPGTLHHRSQERWNLADAPYSREG